MDFDALIETRAESLDDTQLDRAYYDAILRLMDPQEDPYVTGFQIWEHHLAWKDRNTTRPGYLFFGAPNERSTAAPPRDFYLYFLQPFGPPRFRDERKPDEVFFDLRPETGEFRELLARYAGADALMAQSSGPHKEQYRHKAREALQRLQDWLDAHMLGSFRVTSAGRDRTMKTWMQGGPTLRKRTGANPNERIPFRDKVNAVAEICLESHFRDTAPEYPTFGVQITHKTREPAARDALAMIAGQQATRQSQGVLAGLELLDRGELRPDASRYAQAILEILRAKPAGQVASRDELLIEIVRDVEYFDPERARLEPEWVVVLIATLVHSGHIVLTLPGGRKFDALNLSDLAATPLPDLLAFRHLAPPKDWNLPGLTALVELVDLPPGVAKQVTQGRNDAVQQIQKEVSQCVGSLAKALDTMRQGITLWGENLLGPDEANALSTSADGAKTFLESVQIFNTPAKFKNFRHDAADVKRHGAGLRAQTEIESAANLMSRLQRIIGWLSEAQAALPADHAWVASVGEARKNFQTAVRQPEKRNSPAFQQAVATRLAELRKEYERAYLTAHRRARLGPADARRRGELLKDDRLRALSRLAAISLLRRQDLVDVETRLNCLRECPGPTAQDFERSPICPRCSLRPGADAGIPVQATIKKLGRDLDQLVESWTETLLVNLDDPIVRRSRALLSSGQQVAIDAFVEALNSGELSPVVDASLIEAIQCALNGLHKVTITRDAIRKQLFPGGAPATPDQLRRRLDDYIRQLTKGQAATSVRIVLE